MAFKTPKIKLSKKTSAQTSTYSPDYSGAKSADDAWKIYEQAVQKYIDPKYTYQGYGQVYNPLNTSGGGITQLAQMLRHTKEGRQLAEQVKENHPMAEGYMQSNPAHAKAEQGQFIQNRLENQIHHYLKKAENKKDIIPGNAQSELYYQLLAGQNPNIHRMVKEDPVKQIERLHQSPQYQIEQNVQAQYGPIIKEKSQNLIDAAAIMEKYQQLPSKQRTPFLNSLGLTSLADSYRGLTAYMDKDVPITPATLRQAAANLQSGPGSGQFVLNDILEQAAKSQKSTDKSGQMLTLDDILQQYYTGGGTAVQQVLHPPAGTVGKSGILNIEKIIKSKKRKANNALP